MKKRLLALALCLALAVSLLPITAMADFPEKGVLYSWVGGIQQNGTYCGDTYFTDNSPAGFRICDVMCQRGEDILNGVTKVDGKYKLAAGLGRVVVTIGFCENNLLQYPQYIEYVITLNYDHNWGDWTSNGDGTHSRTCGNGCVTPPQKEFCADTDGDHECDDCGASVHTWQVHFTENSLKAKCAYSGCTLGEVGVTLNAHSVTLPASPFHATVDVTENFKEAFPGAEISDILYQYNDSGSWSEVDPKTFTPKPGEYQAGVSVFGIPMGEDAAALSTNDGANQATGSAFLFVKYTAADPAVTAQTGDNRPIEIMMAGAAVFSVLAAAAFILDSKRRYQQ